MENDQGYRNVVVAHIFSDDIHEESMSIHNQPVCRKWLGEDTSTDVDLIDGEGLWTLDRCISVETSLNHPLTK